MSDEQHGPLMLCATRILKPPPTTIVKLGGNVTLPRPVAVRSLVAGTIGAVPLLIIGLAIAGFQGLMFGAVFGAAIGVGFVTWEPQKGETLGKLLGVAAQSRMRRKPLQLGGETVSLSIGVARISRVAEGYVHILPGAVPVNPDEYDERGVHRSPANKNLLDPADRLAGLGGRAAFPGAELPEAIPVPVPVVPVVETPEPVAVEEPVAPEFSIPLPGAPAPAAPAKQNRRSRRRGEPAAPTGDDSSDAFEQQGAAVAPFAADAPFAPHPPVAAPEPFNAEPLPTAAPPAAWMPDTAPPEPVRPDPAPAVHYDAPEPVRHDPAGASAGAVEDSWGTLDVEPVSTPTFEIAAPSVQPPAAPKAKRRRGRGRNVEESPVQAWPDALGAPEAPVPAPPAAPAPEAPAAPVLPAPVAAPTVDAPKAKRRRRRDDDEVTSMLDQWPDPLSGN